MIHKEECFCVTCDNCGETFSDYHSGYAIFVDTNQANEYLDNNQWFTGHETDPEHKGKHYCPDCFKEDPEDEDKIIIDLTRAKTPNQ